MNSVAASPSADPGGEATLRYRSSIRLAIGQFLRNSVAVVGFFCLVLICLAAILAPYISPYDPIQISLSSKFQPPGMEHWLGTDHFGRDVLSRIIWGGRVSLSVGLLVVGFAFAFGVPIGVIAGFLGGRVDNLLMRLMDAFLTFPPLLLGVAIVGLLGASIENVMIALGIVQVPVLARIVRASTLSAREETYVVAARALGAGPLRITIRHILRNILSPIVVQLTIIFAAAVIAEASLSFLGLGTQPPQPSWGTRSRRIPPLHGRGGPGSSSVRPASSCCASCRSTSLATACATRLIHAPGKPAHARIPMRRSER